ncbi:MAG: hypothetical protein H3Z51_02410 [archaeon]|nr:hypothetical protein [archaeon]
MKGSKTTERVDIFIRLIGLIFLILGLSIAYFTANTPLVPQISPIYYFISILFIISGFIALISKLD